MVLEYVQWYVRTRIRITYVQLYQYHGMYVHVYVRTPVLYAVLYVHTYVHVYSPLRQRCEGGRYRECSRCVLHRLQRCVLPCCIRSLCQPAAVYPLKARTRFSVRMCALFQSESV
jgi:hypothetical protein